MTVKITFTCYEKYVHVTILYLLIIVIVILVTLNVFHTHRETDNFKFSSVVQMRMTQKS
jgi:hypothetical protein